MNKKERLNEIIKIIKDSNIVSDHSPLNVRKTIENLGSTFIKIGQILSMRADFLPMEYCKELGKLRGDVLPMPFNEVEDVLNNAYDNYKDVFSFVDKNVIGSASIAEVHRAKLKNGENVVIKIKRLNIDEKIKTDIELLKKAIDITHINHFITIMDLDKALDEIYDVTKEELDFTKEVEHVFKFVEKNNNSYVSAPYIYNELTTTSTIVMEEVKGVKIDDLEMLRNEYDLSLIASILSDNYIKQALDDGMFHADPHPDNIIISDDKIIFLDWGMVGVLSYKNRNLLKECMKRIILEDYKEVTNILVSMSTSTKEFSKNNLENDVKNILCEFGSTSLDNIDTKKFITDMFKMLQQNNLILDHDVTMLIRGITILEGVLEKLDPSINLFQVLSTHVLEEEVSSFSSKDMIKKVGKKIYKSGKSIVDIPTDLEDVLKSIKDGSFKFNMELSDSSRQVDKLEMLVHELIIGFIDGCLIIATSFIDNPSVQFIFIIFIILLSSWLFVRMLIDNKHKGY